MSVSLDGSVKRNTSLSVSQLKDADDLARKYEAVKAQRQRLDQRWKINLAFYKGQQYTFYNKSAGRIEQLPTEDGDKPRFRVRLTSNQIMTGSQSLLSMYTKTKPQISASPGSGDDCDIKAAQMAERLLTYWWGDLRLDDKLEEALLWSIIAGNGWWRVCWDAQAGKAMKFTIGPDGQPITNDGLKTMFLSQLQQMGVPREAVEKVVYLGDIRVEAVSPFNVYVDPTAKTFSDAKWAIVVDHLDPDEIKARWKVDVDADSVSAAADSSLPFGNASDASAPDTKRVFTGYFLPQPALPKGRVVVWMDEPKQILSDDPWQFPENVLPLVKFPGVRVPGQVYDSSVVEHAVPLQKELNRTLSQIVEYKNLTIKPRVWAPVGSLRARLTNEPGAVYEFTPIGGLRPEIEQLPQMPPYVFQHLEDINARLKEVFALNAITQGQVPPNVEAGIAIDLLQEMATDRLAPTIKLIEKALEAAGQQMLSLAQKYYIEPRLIKIKGATGKTQVMKFESADISGGVAVQVETGSGLPRTRAGRQARIEKMVEQGMLTPQQALKHMDIADLSGVQAQVQADEEQAYREHDKLTTGEPINPLAVQEAMKQLQPDPNTGQVMNPETGQPFQSPQEMQEWLQDQAWQPTDFEDWQTHLQVHGLYMKSVEFEGLPVDVQERFLDHFNATRQKLMSLPRLPDKVEAVKTTLQLKGTIGPTGAAQILNKNGVLNITPDTMSEAPLDTWVTDDVGEPDDPNAQSAPIVAHQQMLAQEQQMQQADQQHAAQLGQQQQAADAQHATRMQQLAHADDKHRMAVQAHQHKLALAEAAHRHGLKMKEKAANKPTPKPGG